MDETIAYVNDEPVPNERVDEMLADFAAADAFYAARPTMAALVEALGDIPFAEPEDLEVTPEFLVKLKEAFPAPDYDDMGHEVRGSIGLLSGIRVIEVADLPVPWRFVKRGEFDNHE